tara:strand:- start:39127 stop:40473 length:1347 start_codon:yes stop_codon:yes gene_type:complete
MKYLFTMANKRIALTLIFLLVFGFLQAQKNTDSPYSRYGIGTLNTATFSGNFGLGGVGIAWRPFQYKPLVYDSLSRSNANLNDRGSNFINAVNPASFSNISLTTFEFSVISRNAEYTSGNQSRAGSNTQFGHMSLAVPLGEKAGLAFGIKPYSFIGYDYASSDTVNAELLDYSYEGSGGVNEIYFGLGYEFLKNFSVGVTGSYYFGELIDNRRVIYENTSSGFMNSLDERKVRVNSVSYQLGIQYFKHLNEKYRVVLGAVLSPGEEFNAEQSRIVRNYDGEEGLERFRDTALFEDNSKVKVANRAVLGIGVALEKKRNWMLTADLRLNTWGDADFGPNVELANGQSIHVGFDKYVNTAGFGPYFTKIGYKAGFRYNSSIVRVNSEDISEFGISFGLSLPLRKTFSTLNFGAEVGQRGKDEAGLTLENFFNLQVGVTINDKWFIKRQYD